MAPKPFFGRLLSALGLALLLACDKEPSGLNEPLEFGSEARINLQRGHMPENVELDAVLDHRVANTCLSTPPWPILPEADGTPVWDQPIPRQILQIWLGSPPQKSAWYPAMRAWQAHAAATGMAYRLITDQDLAGLCLNAPQPLMAELWRLYRRGDYRGASDIVRYLALEAWGGIYFDVDMRVPTFLGEPVPLDQLFPLRGLVVVSDGQPVERGLGGMHLLNGVMASCPHHPTLNALVQQIAGNVRCCNAVGEYNPVVMMGPLALTRLVTGPVTVVPVMLWDAVGVSDANWY